MSMRKKGQADVIQAIIEHERVVEVAGHELRLTVPDLPHAIPIMDRAFESADRESGESDASIVREWIELAAAAVAACLGISEEDAGRLVLAAGGHLGELSTTALELCGITRVDVEDAAGDLPT
ncbi:hypothetical protein [Candidatus Palauibacter sp.]|uniref:hypothetical protein n=1 Tax=Candidatus Palauibacter sp. TaxID=3101350 RepID=UPI003CC691D4